MSALDKNLIANAISKNPMNTLKVFIQPPDLGRDFNHVGNTANNAKGIPKANPKPSIAELNWNATADPEPEAVNPVLAKAAPKTGPVHEKDTRAKVKAMKKIPKIPPTLEAESTLFNNLLGRRISKYPKNDIAKTVNTKKNIKFNQTFVEIWFNISASREKKWKGKLSNK